MSNHNKKVLIIAYDYDPLPSIGAQRPFSWYKFFPENNFNVTLITRKWKKNIQNIDEYSESDLGPKRITKNNSNILIEVPYKNSFRDRILLKKKYKYFRKFLTFLEIFTKWNSSIFDEKYFLYEEAKLELKKNKYDLILVSGEPFILFKYADKLSKKHKIPWVADYRDGWSLNHTKTSGLLNKIIQKREFNIEKKLLSSCTMFSSVSQQIVDSILSYSDNQNGYAHINGIDLDLFKNIEKNENNEKFIISYAGSIYEKQNFNDFINAYLSFIKIHNYNNNIVLQFIGIKLRKVSHVYKAIELSKKYPNNIKIINSMPQEQVIEQLTKSSILLKFNMARQSDGMIGAKLYEYITTGSPIITVCSKKEDFTKFNPIKKFQNFAFNSDDTLEILENYYSKYLNQIELSNGATEEDKKKFSKKNNVKEFCNKLKEIV